MKARFILNAKIESSTNVRENDASMNTAVPIYTEGEVLIPAPELSRREFTPISAYSGNKMVSLYKAWGSMKFNLARPLPLHVNSFDGSDIDILLQSASHSRVTLYETPGDDQTPIVGYEFKPETSNNKTLSVDIVGEELKYKGHGAKASFSLTSKVGEPVMISLELNAAFDDVQNGNFSVAFLSPPEAALVDENDVYGHVKIGSDLATAARSEIDELTLDMNSNIVPLKTFKTNAFRMKEFFPTLSLKGDVDTENPYSVDSVVDGTSKALVVRIKDKNDLSDAADETSGKVKWEIVINNMTPDKLPTLSDKDGLGYLDALFNINPTLGNDNYVIRYFI